MTHQKHPDARLLAEIGAARALECKYNAELRDEETPELAELLTIVSDHWRKAARLPVQTMDGALAKLRSVVRDDADLVQLYMRDDETGSVGREFLADVLDFLERPKPEAPAEAGKAVA